MAKKPKKPIAKVPVKHAKHTTKPPAKPTPAPTKAVAPPAVAPDLPGPNGRSAVCYCTRNDATGQAHQHDESGLITYVKVTP